LYVVINTDSRFVMPNRQDRVLERSEAVRTRTSKLRGLFEDRPLLMTRPANVNWATGGLSDPVDITASSDPVWVIETESGRALITNQIEAPRLAHDFDLAALGWDIIGVPWYDAHAPVEAALSFSGATPDELLSDVEGLGRDVADEIVAERMVLSTSEADELRSLGALVGHALGTAIDSWVPERSTDFEIASVLSAELERFGAKAVCLIVGGDDRWRRLRHPLAIGQVLRDAVMAVTVARRGGLHVAATRIAMREEDPHLSRLMVDIAQVHRDVHEASRPHNTWGTATDALAHAYEDVGRAGAWREHFQGGPIAFEQREFELAPGQVTSPYWNLECAAGSAVAWNPSARGGAKIEETYLIGEDDFELLTATDGWPLSEGDGPQHSQIKVVQ